MEVPLSVILVLIVVIGAVGLFVANYVSSYPGSEKSIPPVKASFPSGNPIYKVSNAYVIPVRFAKSTEKPIAVCKIVLNYMDNTGNTREASIVFANSPTSYRTTAQFSDGVVELPTPVITKRALDTTITVKFNGAQYQLNAITIFYCEYGVSTKPKWSETLLIPETVLSP